MAEDPHCASDTRRHPTTSTTTTSHDQHSHETLHDQHYHETPHDQHYHDTQRPAPSRCTTTTTTHKDIHATSIDHKRTTTFEPGHDAAEMAVSSAG